MLTISQQVREIQAKAEADYRDLVTRMAEDEDTEVSSDAIEIVEASNRTLGDLEQDVETFGTRSRLLKELKRLEGERPKVEEAQKEMEESVEWFNERKEELNRELEAAQSEFSERYEKCKSFADGVRRANRQTRESLHGCSDPAIAKEVDQLERSIDQLKQRIFDIDQTIWSARAAMEQENERRERHQLDPLETTDKLEMLRGRKDAIVDEIARAEHRVKELGKMRFTMDAMKWTAPRT